MNEYPYILGFAGRAAAGKTATANYIAPPVQTYPVITDPDKKVPIIYWTKLSFAIPLYRILSIRQKTEGEKSFSRQCHQVHLALVDLGLMVDYDDMVEIVYDICHFEVPKTGKPREFLQWLGTDLLRKYDDDIFVKWMRRQVHLDYHAFLKDNPDTDQAYGVVIDDVRFLNEINWINGQPGGAVIKLDVEPEVANMRLINRDGHAMDPSQQSHPSEAVDTYSLDNFKDVLNTSMLEVEQVATTALDIFFDKQTEPVFQKFIAF